MLQRRGLRPILGALVIAALMVPGSPVQADKNDIVMSRLGRVRSGGGGVIGVNQDFRSMVSELGVVMAPRFLSPADTTGFGGFQFSADVGYTGISNGAGYWRVLEGSKDPTATNAVHGDSLMQTVGVFARKGMWLPLPSFEAGAGVVHLTDSSLWAAQGYAKFALHEGYHDLPLPSLAVRGAVSRMMGSADLDLTIASVDVSISKFLGIAGAMNIEPYGGWGALIMIARSEVIDKTPNIANDREMNFVFKDQDNIIRNRFFAGAKVKYYVFEFTLEASVTLAGKSVDDRSGDTACSDIADMDLASRCDATDQAGVQENVTLSVGLDF